MWGTAGGGAKNYILRDVNPKTHSVVLKTRWRMKVGASKLPSPPAAFRAAGGRFSDRIHDKFQTWNFIIGSDFFTLTRRLARHFSFGTYEVHSARPKPTTTVFLSFAPEVRRAGARSWSVLAWVGVPHASLKSANSF